MSAEPEFFWAVGIENTVNPALGWDQYAWTAHRDLWREDLQRAANLGVRLIRYGLPWPDLNPAPGTFDWTWADAAMAELERLGLEPIWDLLHFGAPAWLPAGLRDKAYPQAVADYAGAFVARYPHVTRITPFNEPYIWAFFSGGNGTWAPHGTTDLGFAEALVPILRGLRQSIQAIRAANPRAEIWLNDGADRFTAAVPELAGLAGHLTGWRYAGFDFLHGRAAPDTPLYALLLEAGMSPGELDEARRDSTPADVIGLDYYPGSEHLLKSPDAPKHPGDWGRRSDYRLYPDPDPPGLAATLLEYHARYGRPLYVAETSTDTRREEWLQWLSAEVLRAREGGASVLGATWWPLFDHIDWNSGLTQLRGTVCPSGLYHLTPQITDRQPDAAADFFRTFIRQPLRAYGVRPAFPT
ncbi:hypothetical protein DKM44_05010 [Deinococcus irradiatisoli]|uniref:Glycoside hydrolase family 42 N-terminal domain-containing protein n=1 Tax=Deinococcus irradiatisoli TaxID=2202254 RepID=A0A2Z3JBZ3_9DEIO|nr:family 1 glycosylhydrolase [Deinococcus irradiatisoli]AWN22673.1 hypothetical protein DKM44_05010 [Deinococcus irradiatisoli]